MANFFSGLTHGMLGLVGAGEAFDPLGDLRSTLSNAKSALQDAQNLGAFTYDKAQKEWDQAITQYMAGNNNIIEEQMQYYNMLTNDKLQEVNVFMILLSLLVIIIIFFLLIK